MPVGQPQAARVRRVEPLARDGVLPGDDLLHALGLHDAERRGELAQAEVEPGDGVIGLAVVAEGARELEQLGVARHEHPALARGDGLGGVEGPHARRRPSCRGGGRSSRRRARARSPRSGRSPRCGTARRCARRRRRCGRRCARGSPRADGGGRPWPRSPRSDMQRSSRLQSTKATSRPACSAASGVAMNVLEGHRTVDAAHAGELQGGQRGARPARERHRVRARSSSDHGRLEALGERALRPALGVDHLVPEVMQPRAVAHVEADREPAEVSERPASVPGRGLPDLQRRPRSGSCAAMPAVTASTAAGRRCRARTGPRTKATAARRGRKQRRRAGPQRRAQPARAGLVPREAARQHDRHQHQQQGGETSMRSMSRSTGASAVEADDHHGGRRRPREREPGALEQAADGGAPQHRDRAQRRPARLRSPSRRARPRSGAGPRRSCVVGAQPSSPAARAPLTGAPA